MRPVNLIPRELRERSGPSDNPVASYAIVGGLGVLLLMVLMVVVYSNKLTTLNDQLAVIQADTAKYQAQAAPVQNFTDFGDTVDKRKLLIGALSDSRFPWYLALSNLSKSLPPDITLDTVKGATSVANASTGAAGSGAQPKPTGATFTLDGCVRYVESASRLLVRMRAMPGVQDAKFSQISGPNAAGGGSGGDAKDQARKRNCGSKPGTFSMTVEFAPLQVDLTGLPKLDTAPAGASGATGAAGADPAAAATAPAPPAAMVVK